MEMDSCCQPTRTHVDDPQVAAANPNPPEYSSSGSGHYDVTIAAGEFVMGDTFGEGYTDDGEAFLHEVTLEVFNIDAAAVTNEQFARFVAATGYRTDAERFETSAVFHLAVAADPADILGRSPSAPWWLEVRGADWAHPGGRHTHIEELQDHPVVHVSHDDAVAYCRWAGRQLPTEAEFEYAARGGRAGQRFPWGNELAPQGKHRANIWHGTFPSINTLEDGYLTTCPVRTFPPNDWGLYETSGNVWEWCADWFSPRAYQHCAAHNPHGPDTGTTRVTRGGSYLCHDSYCHRYRVAARTSNTPDSSTGNCGFRTVSAKPAAAQNSSTDSSRR